MEQKTVLGKRTSGLNPIAYFIVVLTFLRFSAVVRSANAYVPPGARRNGTGPAPPSNSTSQPNTAPSTNPQSANPPTSPVPATTNGTTAPTQSNGGGNNEEGPSKV